jgi:hypothetical protein
MRTADALLATPERFGVAEPPDTFRQTDDTDLERLKAGLLREAIARTASVGAAALLRRAANEAAAIAWLEPHPLLAFPCLFAEFADTARKRHQRQERLTSRTASWLAAA